MLWVKAISAPITAGDRAPAKFPSPLKMPPAVALTRGWVALASRAKILGAPVPHIKVLKLIAAMTVSGVAKCITAARPTAAPASEIKQAAARLSRRSESQAPITSPSSMAINGIDDSQPACSRWIPLPLIR